MAFFACGEVRLMLSLPEKPEFDHASSIIYFKVPDIQQASEILAERGVQIEEQPILIANMGSYDLWMASFRDSENNLLAMMSEVAH